MSENLPVLKVYVLGSFTATYGDKPLSFGKNNQTKAMKLLQFLLYNGGTGIAREKLLEELYGREELADVANNLRVTVHRLKKMLTDAGLPPYDYIKIKKGVYQWDSPMETRIDARVFENIIQDAYNETDEEQKIVMLKKACHMYNGDLLSDLSGEDWVILKAFVTKNLYTESFKRNLSMADGTWRV